MSQAPKLKPIAKAKRSPLARRGVYFRVSRILEEAIFHHARVLSEGGMRSAVPGQSTYFGSTMFSIPFDRLAVYGAGLHDEALRSALVRAIEGSVRVRLRAMRLARAEAARRVQPRTLGTALCEIRASATSKHLHIDVDLEIPLHVISGATRQG